eukprot:5594656-Pyramimonas_sp.AAC.1
MRGTPVGTNLTVLELKDESGVDGGYAELAHAPVVELQLKPHRAKGWVPHLGGQGVSRHDHNKLNYQK